MLPAKALGPAAFQQRGLNGVSGPVSEKMGKLRPKRLDGGLFHDVTGATQRDAPSIYPDIKYIV